MTIARRIFGFVLWMLCLFLLFDRLEGLIFMVRQTQDLEAALKDPVFITPLAGLGLGVLGGVLATGALPGGAVLATLAGVIYLLYALVFLISGGGEQMWFPKLVAAMLMLILSLGLHRLPRRSE